MSKKGKRGNAAGKLQMMPDGEAVLDCTGVQYSRSQVRRREVPKGLENLLPRNGVTLFQL